MHGLARKPVPVGDTVGHLYPGLERLSYESTRLVVRITEAEPVLMAIKGTRIHTTEILR